MSTDDKMDKVARIIGSTAARRGVLVALAGMLLKPGEAEAACYSGDCGKCRVVYSCHWGGTRWLQQIDLYKRKCSGGGATWCENKCQTRYRTCAV